MVRWSLLAGLCVAVVARSPEEPKYTDPVPYPDPPYHRDPHGASFAQGIEYKQPPQYPTEPPQYPTEPPQYPTKPPQYPTEPPQYPTEPPKYQNPTPPPPYYEPNPKHLHPTPPPPYYEPNHQPIYHTSPPPYYEPNHGHPKPTPPPYYEPNHGHPQPTPQPYYEPNHMPHQPSPPPYYEPEYPTEPPTYYDEPEPRYPTMKPMYPTEPPMYYDEPRYRDEPNYPTEPPAYYDEPEPQYPTKKPKYDEEYYDESPYDRVEHRRPVSPSKSMATGYVPEEIMKFRKTYVDLMKRFKGTPLLTSQELFAESSVFYPQEKYPEEGRGGRAFNWQGMLTSLGIAPTAFGMGAGSWPFNMLGNSVGLTQNDQVNVGGSVQLFDTGRALAGPKKAKPQMKDVEPCGNGDGTCEASNQCFIDGGESIGKCLNCLKCSACCKYAYEDQSMSNKTISFFQSPGYPDTRRDAYSSSYTLEIRYDVSQVLIEFEDFEMPISPAGCTDLDYFEIISTLDPNGILGPGNSKFCGLNTDQHLYLNVRGGDLLIFKAVTSGVGFVPLAQGPGGMGYYDYDGKYVYEGPLQYDEYGKPYGHDDGKGGKYDVKKPKRKPPVYPAGDSAYRFQVKITQIIDSAPYRYLTQKGSGKAGAGKAGPNSGGEFKVGQDFAKGYIQLQSDIPDYYRRLGAPSGCKQYFMEQSGTVESFNFDGHSMMPNNLDYSVCFRVPELSCGISISALKFDIPAWNPECMSGEKATSGGFPCCTAGSQTQQDEYGTVDTYGKYGQDVRVEKFLGIDGTSDGFSKGPNYKTNLLRYFFCGENMGKTNFVVSERKGPFRLQVYSDGNYAKNYYGEGHGFRIKYEVDTGC